MDKRLILASTSPRRRELLSGLGVEFQVMPPSASEDPIPNETPQELVKRLALDKAMSIASNIHSGHTPSSSPDLAGGAFVIGGDSTVVLGDRVMGKPADSGEARRMLEALRGREHQVMTGVAVVDTNDLRAHASTRISTVIMREYSDEEIEAYVASGEPLDKAGGYAVQDKVFRPAARLEGCYTGTMGLPLCTLMDLLKDAGSQIVPKGGIRLPEGCTQCPLRDYSHVDRPR
jgi:MAF protein